MWLTWLSLALCVYTTLALSPSRVGAKISTRKLCIPTSLEINSNYLERKQLKLALLEQSAKRNRGELNLNFPLSSSSSSIIADEMLDIISNLESINPAYDDANNSYSLEGEWELIYTDTQLFESSPFFLTLRELLGKRFNFSTDRVNNIFNLHRAATSTGSIGRITQTITKSQLMSKVEVNVGLLPGIPISLSGLVVSTADAVIEDQFTLKLKLVETKIAESNIPVYKSLPESIRRINFGSFGEIVPPCVLTTYYIDENMRITRNQDDNVFVYSRVN